MRFNLVGLIIGQRGTGKSLFVLGSKYTAREQDKNLGIAGVIDTYLVKKKMKVLIIDTLDHPSYRSIEVLKQSDFKKFKTGIKRIYLEPDNVLKLVNYINQSPHMNNTLIVFEDAVKYTGARLDNYFKRLIADSKQRNIDIIFMYHCFIDTPSNIFTKSDFIQLFKTEDNPYVRKNTLRLFDKILNAYEIVKSNANNFYGKYIDTRTN